MRFSLNTERETQHDVLPMIGFEEPGVKLDRQALESGKCARYGCCHNGKAGLLGLDKQLMDPIHKWRTGSISHPSFHRLPQCVTSSDWNCPQTDTTVQRSSRHKARLFKRRACLGKRANLAPATAIKGYMFAEMGCECTFATFY